MPGPEEFSPPVNQVHIIDRCYGTKGKEEVEKAKKLPGVNVIRAIPDSGEIVIVSCNNINPETSQCGISAGVVCPRKDLASGNLPDSTAIRLFIPMAEPGWSPRSLSSSNSSNS